MGAYRSDRTDRKEMQKDLTITDIADITERILQAYVAGLCGS